jgi:hypothetical protein
MTFFKKQKLIKHNRTAKLALCMKNIPRKKFKSIPIFPIAVTEHKEYNFQQRISFTTMAAFNHIAFTQDSFNSHLPTQYI